MALMGEGSVDAVVCDPPYGLEFMGKEWDRLGESHIGNPDMTRHRRVLPEAGQRGVAYGAPRRNPWCRRCGKYAHAPHASKCHCPNPDWNTRQDEGGRQQQGWHLRWAEQALRVLKPGGFAAINHDTPIPNGSRWWAHGFGWFLYRDGKWGFLGGDPHLSAVRPSTDEPTSWGVWDEPSDAALWVTI
jgi:tRNA G10  N-methylase Trm11